MMEKTKKFFRKLSSFAKHPFIRKNEPILHTIEWIFILLAFFVVGFSMIYSQEGSSYLLIRSGNLSQGGKNDLIKTKEDEKLFIGEVIREPIDTTEWDTYQNKWYGFEINHPDAWKNNTQYKTATEKSAVYETIYKFRRDDNEADDTYEGYDVKIYSVRKVKSLENTNDVRKKDGAPEDMSGCHLSEEVSLGSEGIYFQKVSITEDNPCYEPAYFYSVTKGDFIYNIIPVVGLSGERFPNPEKETARYFPEYKEAVSTFKLITISRPQARSASVSRSVFSVRRPVSAKIVNGKLVCAKKNDHPRKSKNNKPGHLDLECCLDPDERPNPWCTY